MNIEVFKSQGATAVQNALFDTVMPRVSGNAWKLLCLIIRQTSGWNRKHIGLSYRDLIKGIGVSSRSTVAAALEDLAPFNLIISSHTERWEETQFSLNFDAVVDWTATDFSRSDSVTKTVPVTEIVTGESVTESVPVTEIGTDAPVTEIGTAPVTISVPFIRKDINNQNKDLVVARARDRYNFNDLPFASEAPGGMEPSSGEQNPRQTQGAPPPPVPVAESPDRTPATIYAQVGKRQLAIAEIELIETRVPQAECDQFERFLTGWAATYGTKAIFKVLNAYDEQKPKQHTGFIGRAWTAQELADYHADMRRLANSGKADKPVANPRKHLQPAVDTGTVSGSAGRVAGSAQRRTGPGSPPTLQFGAYYEAQKSVQQSLERRRLTVRVEETPSEPDMELPF